MLPQTVEYALRAMGYLARQPNGYGARAADIARVADVPPQYLKKLLRRLVVGGLLVSQRGHGGGFVLARPAAEISFREVMAALDFELVDDHCIFGWKACDATVPCPLHDAWSSLKGRLADWAEHTTLDTACDD